MEVRTWEHLATTAKNREWPSRCGVFGSARESVYKHPLFSLCLPLYTHSLLCFTKRVGEMGDGGVPACSVQKRTAYDGWLLWTFAS
jgi:hypothetical protein